MVVAYYILGAALAAWLTTGNEHLDWKLSLLVLPLMYLAHLSIKAMAGGQRSGGTGASPNHLCLSCPNKIGMLRRMARHRFCCDDHERAYLAELEELAIQRLRNACSAAPLQVPINVPSYVPILVPGAPVSVSSAAHCNAISQPAAPQSPGHEQTLSLIVRPKAAGFSPAPAYRAAM